MNIIKAINKIVRFQVECPYCLNDIKSDDIYSPLYGITPNEVHDEICISGGIEIECHHCNSKFTIDEVDWDCWE